MTASTRGTRALRADGLPAPAPPARPAVVASTPGKLILLGEHAAVYGRPALVAAIDLRLRARFRDPEPGEARPGHVRLDLGRLGPPADISWAAIRDYTAAARDRWRQYSQDPGRVGFAQLQGSEPSHLVRIALGEASDALGEIESPDLALEIDSELPVGSGFGSSAAAGVALVAGYAAWRGKPLGVAEVERVALDVERRQHGFPSGVDTATSLRGGLLWARRRGPDTLDVEAITATSPHLARLRVYDTGPPSESTGAVVAAVRERVRARPAASEARFDRMGELVTAFRQEIGNERDDPARVIELLRFYEACLEELGVVPEPVQRVVRAVEAAGGAAKISGAGSLDGPGGGSLLVYHARPEEIAGWPCLQALRHLKVSLGAPGFSLAETAR